MRRLVSLALILAFLLVQAPPARAGIVLEASTDSLELVTSTAAGIDYNCSWTDGTTTTFTPGKSAGAISSATTTPIVAAPAASTQRNILNCTFRNTSTTTANVLTVQRDVSTTNRTMFQTTLAPGEMLVVNQNGDFNVLAATGIQRVQATDQTGFNGITYPFMKVGTAKDAGGYWIASGKDAGLPSNYALGSPGINGWTTDCSVANNAADPAGAVQLGANLITDPVSGNLYLTNLTISGTVVEMIQLIDVLWYNTGINVTTTTLQAITTPTLPARDINGTTNGDGVNAALLTTTANTNAGTISNTQINYTDSDGNTGNVGFFTGQVGLQAPVTPVIGTWVPFSLAAGDRGIRAITNASGGGITLGTSYGGGALSLVFYRVLTTFPITVANMPTNISIPAPGIRVHPNSCIWALAVGSGSATTLIGSYTILER